MMRSQLLMLVIATITSISANAQDIAITKAETVVAIYSNDWGLRSSGGPRLIASIWGNGTVVWSGDNVNGGAPYFESKLDPKVVIANLERISDLGFFDVPRLKQANFGPDSKFTSILIRMDGKELKMESWHELYESNGKVVATDHGLTGLNNRKLLNALSDQSAEYLHYRLAWLELRLAVANLIPKSGAKTTGEPAMSAGNLSWKSSMKK